MAENEVYKAGEIVLAFHGPLLYEAKILAVENRVDQSGDMVTQYLTHYKGWNRSWDEWLNLDRIKKMNDTNLAMQQLLKDSIGKKKKGKGRADTKHETTSKKRRNEPTSAESNDQSTIETKIVIPNELKLALVEDWNLITRQSMIMKLPRSPTINEILAEYSEHVASQGPKTTDVVREVTSGLKLYFQSGCGSILLYKQERPQYDELIQENEAVNLCDHYGIEHLLRLFVKLPAMLQHSGVGPKGTIYLMKCLQDILRYIKSRDKSPIDTTTYIPYSASYAQKVKSA